MRRVLLSGTPSLSAFPITPANAQGEVDTAALRKILERLVRAKVDSVCVLGSTGSGPYLTESQRTKVLEISSDVLTGQDSPQFFAGIGGLCTHQVVSSAKAALKHGAVAGLLAPISYLPLNEEEVANHVAIVAAAVPELPLILYDNPVTTRFAFSNSLIARLAAIDNVVGVKTPARSDSAQAFAAHEALKLEVSRDDFAIGYSVDVSAIHSLLAGGDAWFSVAGGIAPVQCQRIVDALRSGETEKSHRFHDELQPLWNLFNELSSFRVAHAAAECLGLGNYSPPLPILPLQDADKERVRQVLEQLDVCEK